MGWHVSVWCLLKEHPVYLRTGAPALPIKSCLSHQPWQHSKWEIASFPTHRWERPLIFIEILILMTSFYCPIDLCNGCLTVYPIDSYIGSYGWLCVQLWQISSVCFYSGHHLCLCVLPAISSTGCSNKFLAQVYFDLKRWQTAARKRKVGGSLRV